MLALLSVVTAGTSYAAPSADEYRLIPVKTQGSWKGGPKQTWKSRNLKVASKYKGKTFYLDKNGRPLGPIGKTDYVYVASMRIDKSHYQTVWRNTKGYVFSVCEKGNEHQVASCSVIGINPKKKTYVTANLIPAKES